MSWKERFASKIVTAAQAADRIRDNSLIRFPMGVPPPTLLGELIARRGKVHGLTVNQGIPALPYPFAGDASWRDSIRLQTDFISPPIRGAVNSNIVDFLVTEYSLGSKVTEGEGRQNNWNCDVFAALLTVPESHDYSYFGFSLWHSMGLIRNAKLKIAEVGPEAGSGWPFARLGGDGAVNLNEFDLIIEGAPQMAMPPAPPSAEAGSDRQLVTDLIGAYVSTLVNDRETIQIGTGTVSSSVGIYLNGHKDLGIDSEIIVPSVIELMKAGCVSGAYKKFHPGKVTGSLIVPYTDFTFVDNNPAFELYDIEYCNSLPRIATIPRLVAINQALAMDLTGQVAAESLGHKMWSGPGGQMVWNVGAMYSPGGRAITVLPSTAVANGKKVSRIVSNLEPGTVLTVPRTFVDFVVTEHGIVNLQGKTERERATAMISIADPEFQEPLERAARELFGK